jgi:hypothetical protein
VVFNASTSESFYLLPDHSEVGYVQSRVLKDDLVTLVHFLMRRLTIDNRGPNHPAGYDIAFLQTDLFKEDIFGKILALPISGDGVDQYNNSRLKNVFVQQIATFCYNDPAQIPKMIQDGTLSKVADMLKTCLPIHQVSINVLYEFVRMITVHKDGTEFIKTHKLFERCLLPFVREDSQYK